MRTLLIMVVTLACTLTIAGCKDAESITVAQPTETSTHPVAKGYTLTQAETAVMRMQIAHRVATSQLDIKLKTVNPSELTTEAIKELINDSSSPALLKGIVASYEEAPDGKSVYLYFAESLNEKDKEKLSSVAWLAVPRPALRNGLITDKQFEIACMSKAYINNVARFTECVPLSFFKEILINAIAREITQQAEQGEISEDVVPIIVRAINLAADRGAMSECFSEIGEEIQGAIPAINCAQRRESYRLTSVADTLNTKGLKQLTGKSTSSNIGANISTQLNAVIPVDPAPSYQMTDLEATVFKAWLHNDIAHWIEISEAGEAPHPATKHLPSYLGDLTLISAKELETAYYENEVAADLRFLKKRLLVHGKIGSINSGLRNKPYIHFSTGNRFQAPSASFKDPDLNTIARLKRDQPIRLVCMGAGEMAGTPRLDDCEFADDVLKRTLTEKVAQVKNTLLSEPKMLSDLDLMLYALSVVQASTLPEHSICKSGDDLGKCATSLVKSPKPSPVEILQLQRQMIARGAASAGLTYRP